MDPDRVEMSVGNETVNGDHLVNGIAPTASSINTKPQPGNSSIRQVAKHNATPFTNGDAVLVKRDEDGMVHETGSILQDAPPELLQILSSEFYLPMARLVSRSAQSCWNDLLSLVDRLASIPAPVQNISSGVGPINDQSKVNLDKKDLLLNFAKEHKDVFIKLLVLLQWSRKSDEVRKTIELNLWLQQRRQAFNNATGMLGAMLRALADSQVPNPDLYTASEVLATGNVSSMPKLDYLPQPPLTPRQILRILNRLDTNLCTRMALIEDIPSQLNSYHIHDGRVTFTVSAEFNFDISTASEDSQAKFEFVDFEFLFSPAPSIPDRLHNEIALIANAALDKDGFTGVYEILHDLTLSYKLNELTKQARKLSQGLWNGHLRVEVLRRTLVVQYWLKNSTPKSWLEIGVHSGGHGDSQGGSRGRSSSELRLRWFRDSKLADSDEIYIDISHLSFEDILRQAIAQHTNHMFDAIYDKLLASSLYANARLELNQTASTENPAECVLEVQLSKTDNLVVSVEPIGGSLVLSPVSEKVSRLQFDLARSKAVVEDFVARLPNLRSGTAEFNLTKALPNSQWQRLEGFKVSLPDAEMFFGPTTTRVSCMRLKCWAPQWIVAVTQSATGDDWWLIQCTQPNTIAESRTTKIVDKNPLYTIGSPSPAYLERLAEYVTGVIELQCNAHYLNTNNFTWRLCDIPPFDGQSRLPPLQFSRNSVLSSTKPRPKSQTHQKDSKSRSDVTSIVHLTYHGTSRTSKKVVMVAKAALVADTVVLKDLASSGLDQSVIIVPEKQQIMTKVESDAGTPVIETLLSKLSHLENIVACVAAVKRSNEHTLQSLSLLSITIMYHNQPDLGLRIDFGQQPDDLSASFLPADDNPQHHLAPWIIKSMRRSRHHAGQNLAGIFVVLKMTRPMLSYLQNIQSAVDPTNGKSGTINSHLRVHLLHRQPTAYGLQYFADSSNFDRDESGLETPKKLLARFEILAMKHGEKLMWMVRPAIEEFHHYNRPSYTSNALREKLDQEIFKKPSPSWLALDGGAACPSDRPEQLMSAIHEAIMIWAKDAVKPEAVGGQGSASAGVPPLNHSSDKKPTKPNPPATKPQQPQQRPNGVQRPQQPVGQQKQQSFNNRGQFPKPSEVITLD